MNSRPDRKLRGRCFALLLALLPVSHAQADTLFRLTEEIVEQEVQPREARHTGRWQGDYYVADDGVSVSGWGGKASQKPIPYDSAHHGTTPQGSAYTSIFHRLPDGLDVRIEYDSFVLERRIVQTGVRTCADQVTVTLKPGHTFFEVRRLSTHEPMLESSRVYRISRCEFPPLLG